MKDKLNKYISFLYLIRLNNCIIAVISVIVAAYIANVNLDTSIMLYAIITIFLLMAGGNIINDFYDIDTDKINKPKRPLISYNYNIKTIIMLAIICFIAGNIFSFFLGWGSLIITMFSSLLLFLYSKKLKRMLFWGNFAVSLLSGMLFIYGAFIAGNIQGGYFPAIFAFLMTMGREITKDIEDIEGDMLSGMKTMPIVIGKEKSFIIAFFVFLSLIALTFYPYFTGMYNRWYFFIVVFGVDIVIIILLLMFFIFDDINTKRFVNNYLKYDMMVGLLAMIIGVNI